MIEEPPVTDSSLRLFQAREKIYPVSVKGKYRTLKWCVMTVLLAIYYITPWLRWDRGPLAPDQAILIDMPGRRAYFFFIEIWPQEVYYLMGILILSAVGLFLVTALLGRVWCGYACPQTVWTDLFIVVERFFQGDRNQQIKRDKGPWTLDKISRKLATHVLWLVIALLTGGAWVFYFNDAPTIFEQITHFRLPLSVGGWIAALTGSTYLMAGFAREQVCMYMCPYARFQSAMFDKDTLIIGYDEKRGEARGHHKRGDSWEGRGHCIDCTRCVQVCPTGIDIRNGLQMECIACGLCVDACNEVMDKIDLPRGLIRYDSARHLSAVSNVRKFNIFRPRIIYYAVIITIVCALMVLSLDTRVPLELNVLHDRNPLFVTLSDGKARNGYTIKILNKTPNDQTYTLDVKNLTGATVVIHGTGDTILQDMPVFSDSVGQFRVFISAMPSTDKKIPIQFVVKDKTTGLSASSAAVFIGEK